MTTSLHPHFPRFENLFRKLLPDASEVSRHLFRMVNPKFCKDTDIINGEGGRRASGRWNIKGLFCCTYASFTPETALEESLAATRRKNLPDEKALPRTLVCIDLHATKALDLTDGKIRQRCRVSMQQMRYEQWWIENLHNREAVTQALGRAAFQAGFEAMLVPSSTDTHHRTNVIIFPELLLKGSYLDVLTPIKGKE